jgi:membrane protein DedA with SNARE-associated domain
VIGLGYFFGHSLHVIEKVLGVGGVIAVVSVAAVALVMWRRFERGKLHQHDGESGAAPPPPSA